MSYLLLILFHSFSFPGIIPILHFVFCVLSPKSMKNMLHAPSLDTSNGLTLCESEGKVIKWNLGHENSLQ